MGYKIEGKVIIRPDGTFLGSGRSNAEAKLIANQLNQYEQTITNIENTLDECERKRGDAPHRAVDHCARIRVLAGQSRTQTSETPLIDYLKTVIPPQATVKIQ
jgi:hypothetical protein